MVVMNLLFWKKKQLGNPQIMTDEMRERSLETRRLNARIQQLEKRLESKQQLEYLEQQINGGSGNNMENMILMMLAQSFLKPNIPKSTGDVILDNEAAITPQSSPVDYGKIETAVNILKPKLNGMVINQLRDLTDSELIEIRRRLTE